MSALYTLFFWRGGGDDHLVFYCENYTKRPHRVWGPTQPHIQLIPVYFFGGKAAGVWCSPLTYIQCWGSEWVELYLYSPTRLHGAYRDLLYRL